MSKGFTFENDLEHQTVGVNSVLSVLSNAMLETDSDPSIDLRANPYLNLTTADFLANVKRIQEVNNIEHSKEFYDKDNRIIDVSMETGTGKTFTYTKTMLELHKAFGINKFIVAVPTLAIKAGTVNFLKSDGLKDLCRSKFDGREIKVHIVESKKKSKHISQAVRHFVEAAKINKKHIHVLVINSGMINAPSFLSDYDTGLIDDKFYNAISAIRAIKPVLIIDEPHKFPTDKKTWENIGKFNAQFTIRYGATFNDYYYNLVYRLTAVDSFNQDLIKSIDAYIEDYVGGDDKASIRFIKSTGKEATFELSENASKKTFKLAEGDSLTRIHPAIHELLIEKLSKTLCVLSNGNELKINTPSAIINPYSYSDTLEDNMMRKAIKEHFKLERQYLTEPTKIKPLTLFFIDDIEGYRDGNNIAGSLKTKFEEWVLAEAKALLKEETDPFYKSYLEKTIADVASVHGGYFSKDNSDKDDKIEQEVNEILHDKELLLSLSNPRRFIFSKWTLREGWDNPNVFQICKLRSSGSTTSKLQEVGRGLRLPVNEYMQRIKDRKFTLNYYVDFSEKDFVESLINEVNTKSFKETVPSKLTEEIKDKIIAEYPDMSKFKLMNELVNKGIVDENENFMGSDGYSKLKQTFPRAFPAQLKPTAIKRAVDGKRTTKMRVGKFNELKELWDLINKKAVLEYKIATEDDFFALFKQYLIDEADKFKKSGIKTRRESVYIHNDIAMSKTVHSPDDDDFAKLSTMTYREFLERLSQEAFIKLSTLHRAFVKVKDTFEITDYLNIQTIKKIKSGFSYFLLNNSIGKFGLGYNIITSSVHPTKFTNSKGEALSEVVSSDLGVMNDDALKPFDNYLFEEVFYDSELERLNIVDEEILSVSVFTKIPKNSIKIPVAGGYTYSPDFAYVVKTKSGEFLNFIIETKNVEGKENLRKEEAQKIEHAKILFNKIGLDKNIKIEFKTQFSDDKIIEFIRPHL